MAVKPWIGALVKPSNRTLFDLFFYSPSTPKSIAKQKSQVIVHQWIRFRRLEAKHVLVQKQRLNHLPSCRYRGSDEYEHSKTKIYGGRPS